MCKCRYRDQAVISTARKGEQIHPVFRPCYNYLSISGVDGQLEQQVAISCGLVWCHEVSSAIQRRSVKVKVSGGKKLDCDLAWAQASAGAFARERINHQIQSYTTVRCSGSTLSRCV
jgi:hypothetical protein